ncbi:MAG: GNAT family N-acetyltransferase [Victivallaceae bacterium]|nr:GNAT family N-acetyltransferase [Victivallaceae bacterium]
MRLRDLIGKAARFVRQTHSDYVVAAFSAAPGIDPNALPEGAGELTEFNNELIDRAFHSGRMNYAKAGLFRHLTGTGSRSVVITDEKGVPAAWSILSINTPTGSFGGITVRPQPPFAYIHDTFVTPEFRGRGYGTLLNARMIALYGEGRTLFCLVRCNNLPALRNWKKCGAEKLAIIVDGRSFRGNWNHKVTVLSSHPLLREILALIRLHH